jgi:hypothetical protein
MKQAIALISKKYIEYTQENGLNFQTDIISLPTGDGAATIFSFDGLHDIHLAFALALLEKAHELSRKERCDKFEQEGWCNCHPYFNLRIGISEGKGIVFTDLRGDYNVAGDVVNMAARVMGFADRNQILFTEEAHHQIVDMIEDPHFVDLFTEFRDVSIKHDIKINLYQYTDKKVAFLNTNASEDLIDMTRIKSAIDKMRGIGFPIPFDPSDRKSRVEGIIQMERIAELMSQISRPVSTGPLSEANTIIELPSGKPDTNDTK